MSHVAAQLAKFPFLQAGTVAAVARAAASAERAARSTLESIATVLRLPPAQQSGAALALQPCASARSAAHAGGAAAGLVPYKTSLGTSLSVSFSPEVVAERRVNRLKKSVWASGHLHGITDSGQSHKCWFVTLTYAQANAWCPKHISAAVQGYRNWCASNGVSCRYTWVAEIQPKRLERTGDAVVHYHLLAWLPELVEMPKWDLPTTKFRGVRPPFWAHGMSNTQKAYSGVGYLMKYLSKLGELTIFPKGLRLYGIGGLNPLGRSVRRWFNLPAWVKLVAGVGDVLKVGNAFVMRATGEILETPYSVVKTQWGLELKALREIPARWFDGAYSSWSPKPESSLCQ